MASCLLFALFLSYFLLVELPATLATRATLRGALSLPRDVTTSPRGVFEPDCVCTPYSLSFLGASKTPNGFSQCFLVGHGDCGASAGPCCGPKRRHLVSLSISAGSSHLPHAIIRGVEVDGVRWSNWDAETLQQRNSATVVRVHGLGANARASLAGTTVSLAGTTVCLHTTFEEQPCDQRAAEVPCRFAFSVSPSSGGSSGRIKDGSAPPLCPVDVTRRRHARLLARTDATAAGGDSAVTTDEAAVANPADDGAEAAAPEIVAKVATVEARRTASSPPVHSSRPPRRPRPSRRPSPTPTPPPTPTPTPTPTPQPPPTPTPTPTPTPLPSPSSSPSTPAADKPTKTTSEKPSATSSSLVCGSVTLVTPLDESGALTYTFGKQVSCDNMAAWMAKNLTDAAAKAGAQLAVPFTQDSCSSAYLPNASPPVLPNVTVCGGFVSVTEAAKIQNLLRPLLAHWRYLVMGLPVPSSGAATLICPPPHYDIVTMVWGDDDDNSPVGYLQVQCS